MLPLFGMRPGPASNRAVGYGQRYQISILLQLPQPQMM
jgi:hypothetical protein